MSHAIIRRAGALAALALLGFTGCLDSTGVDEDEPQIAGVQLTAALGSNASGTTTVVEGTQTNALTLRANSPNTLTVRVLGLDFNDEPLVMMHSTDYEIRLLQDDVPLISTIDGGYPYAFTVTPSSAPGTFTFAVQVISIAHGHAEAEIPVQITIAAAP